MEIPEIYEKLYEIINDLEVEEYSNPKIRGNSVIKKAIEDLTNLKEAL